MKIKKGFVLLIIIVFLIIYLYCENNILTVTRYEITNEKIETAFDNFKIVQLSDYHNTKSRILNESIVKEIENIKPDIIVITGDFLDSNRTDLNVSLTLIKRIIDIAPVYFITGNHEECIEKFYLEFKNSIELLGVKILENEVEVIEKGDSKINLIGISDTDTFSGCKEKLSSMKYDKEYYSVLLSHRPEFFTAYVHENINLVLTGHAHGGQIRLPLIGGLIAPNQGFFPKYTSGKFVSDSTVMVVSRGIGNSIIPFRVNNRPELIVITLKSN